MGDALEPVRAARRELDEVVEEIRAVEGHEDFLAPPTVADVTAVATEQPLAYLVPAESGGMALVVRGDQVEHCDLPALSLDAVAHQTGQFTDAYDRFRRDPMDEAAHTAWTRALDEVTNWLWPAAMDPLLKMCVATPGSAGAVTVVAGGLLGLLPLHAAWTPDDVACGGRRYALDVATISYAPNARSLAAARSVADSVAGEQLLIVADPPQAAFGQPEHSGQSQRSGRPLHYAAAEAACAAAAFPEATTLLSGNGLVSSEGGMTEGLVPGGQATLAAVRRELAGADVLHFACHGSAHLDSPLDSNLLLPSGEALRLRELLDMQLRARLAVLSACETSRLGTDLPDEVVSLPTGLLQAGAAGVVATLWTIDDLTALMIMIEFYRRWRWEGTAPAPALRDAQRWVRDTTNEDKIDAWQRAVDEEAGWLPPAVADILLDRVMFRPDRAARDEAGPACWAAFVHVGV